VCDPTTSTDPMPASLDELRSMLTTTARALDVLAGRWLVALGEFDRVQGWIADGALSAVDWLVTHARLARGTAYEKVRVAAELRRRPLVAAALAAGTISYSAARAITRALGATRDVDEALIDVAVAGTVTDVERMVAAYLRYADQDRPPTDPTTRRGLRAVPGPDGTTRIEAVLTDTDAAELLARLDRHATAAPHATGTDRRQFPSRPAARADALVELARTAATTPIPAAERYTVHTVVTHGAATLLAGRPLDPATTAAITCDCTTIDHHVTADGNPLALGRLRRTWSAAQRRAVTVRDGGHCRWPGCQRATTDVHHVLAWDHGGTTDVTNGVLLCPRHHTLTHAGWTTTGTATTGLTWHHPTTGQSIGTTRPDHPTLTRLASLARGRSEGASAC
jgi:hypothetical protein